MHCREELVSLWWDKINTLEREPWWDGSPRAAQTKGFSVAKGVFFLKEPRTQQRQTGKGRVAAAVILPGLTRAFSSWICCLWRVLEEERWEGAQICSPGTGALELALCVGAQGWRGGGWPCLCSLQCTDGQINKKKGVQLPKLPFSVLAMVFIVERLLIYKIPGVLNNNNKKILTILINTDYSGFLSKTKPRDPPAHSDPPSQPRPPPSTDSRAAMSKGEGAKPEGTGRAQQSVCHCDNLLKGGGQGIIKYPGLKS